MDGVALDTRPPFTVSVRALPEPELQARLGHYAMRPGSPVDSFADEGEGSALELARSAPGPPPQRQPSPPPARQDLIVGLSTCVHLLVVVLTLCISTCVAMVGVGLVRSGAIYSMTRYMADELPQVIDKVRVIEQASLSSAGAGDQGVEIAQALVSQNNAMARQLLLLQRNVTLLTQTFVQFVKLLQEVNQPKP